MSATQARSVFASAGAPATAFRRKRCVPASPQSARVARSRFATTSRFRDLPSRRKKKVWYMFEHAYTFWVLLRDETFGTITLRLEFDGGKSQDQSVASPERWVNIRIQTTSLKTIGERLAATLTGGASELYASMALCSVRVV